MSTVEKRFDARYENRFARATEDEIEVPDLLAKSKGYDQHKLNSTKINMPLILKKEGCAFRNIGS